MKSLLLLITIYFFTAFQPAKAFTQQDLDMCVTLGEIAEIIMTDRQMGKPIEYVLVTTEHKFFVNLTLYAYSLPMVHPDSAEKAAKLFSDKIKKECIKAQIK